MKQITILAVLAALTVFGLAQQASAQTIPNVHGLQAFSIETDYMSLSGYLRWQSFKENNIWITNAESGNLVKSELTASN